MKQFPNLPVDNSLPTKVTALTWTLSSNCSCKPSLCSHFTSCKKPSESWLNHYPLSGDWATLMTDKACEKPWLRSWWGSRAGSNASVREEETQTVASEWGGHSEGCLACFPPEDRPLPSPPLRCARLGHSGRPPRPPPAQGKVVEREPGTEKEGNTFVWTHPVMSFCYR